MGSVSTQLKMCSPFYSGDTATLIFTTRFQRKVSRWICIVLSAPPEAGWRPVRVPHRSREVEDNPPTSRWYRTDLQVPAEWPLQAGRCLLDLGRVRHFGRACLDGRVLGEHFHTRMPWLVDLGEAA